MPPNPPINWAKLCGLLGFVAGEIYMFFTVASPRLQGVEIPTSAILTRMLATAPLFGGFGLALGTGIGLLLNGLFSGNSKKKTEHGHPSDPHRPNPPSSTPFSE